MGEKICENVENGLDGMKFSGQWGRGWRASWFKLKCVCRPVGEIGYGKKPPVGSTMIRMYPD